MDEVLAKRKLNLKKSLFCALITSSSREVDQLELSSFVWGVCPSMLKSWRHLLLYHEIVAGLRKDICESLMPGSDAPMIQLLLRFLLQTILNGGLFRKPC